MKYFGRRSTTVVSAPTTSIQHNVLPHRRFFAPASSYHNHGGGASSHVGSRSRGSPLKWAVWATAIIMGFVIANALRSRMKQISQIESHSMQIEELQSKCPPLRAVVIPNEKSTDICSHREQHAWRDSLDRYFEELTGEMPTFAVVLTVNTGYLDFFINWHRYFRMNSIQTNHVLIIIAEDATIHRKLVSMFDSVESDTIVLPGYDATNDHAHHNAEDYDSFNYKSLVSTRATHLLNLICILGATNENTKRDIVIVYSDVDTVWVRDPFPSIQTLMGGDESYDILAAVDDHDYWCVKDYYCTGFIVIAQSSASISFLSHWEKELKYAPQLNQPIFNTVLRSPMLPEIRHGGLGEIEFPPGRLYFDRWAKEGGELERQNKDRSLVVHNNYIVGHDAKKKRFEEHGIWIDKKKTT